jgi:hypothetical protein
LVEQMQHRSVEGILISQSARHIQITPVCKNTVGW